jgi:hypothetical protein
VFFFQEVPESDSDSSAQTERAKKEAEPQPSTSKEPAPAAPAAAAAAPTVAPAAAPAADKWESSNSEHSGDEYHVYYYDPKALVNAGSSTSAEDPDAVHAALFANCRRMDDPWEILFARAEALHAHGHSREVIVSLIFVCPLLMVD